MRSIIERFRILYINPRFRVLFFLNVLLGFAYSFVAPFMSMFGTQEIGMSNMLFGIFMTMTAAGGLLIGTTLARYSDTHFSRRSMLLWSSLAGALGYAAYAYLRSFVPLVIVGTLAIGMSTATFTQLFAYASEVLKTAGIAEKEQAFYMNMFRMFFALSWTVGPAIAAWIMINFSFHGLFLCAAVVFVLFACVVAKYIPAAPPPFAMQAARSSQTIFKVLQRVDLLSHLCALALVNATINMYLVNLPLFILETIHGTKTDVGIAFSVAPMFELPFMVYFGWLATRRESAGILRIGMVLALAYYCALLLVAHPWQVYVCQMLSAAMIAVVSGVAITYFQSHMPHHPGTATNLYSNAQRVGSTAGYFLFGLVAEQFGYRAVFGLCASFAFVALLLMLVPVRVPADEAEAI